MDLDQVPCIRCIQLYSTTGSFRHSEGVGQDLSRCDAHRNNLQCVMLSIKKQTNKNKAKQTNKNKQTNKQTPQQINKQTKAFPF